MRKSNNNQKTENSRKENPASRIFAVVLSLVLISMTVSANGFWKHLLIDNSYGRMATLMVSGNSASIEHLNHQTQVKVPEKPAGGQISDGMLIFNQHANDSEINGKDADGTRFQLPLMHSEKQVILQTQTLTLRNDIWNN